MSASEVMISKQQRIHFGHVVQADDRLGKEKGCFTRPRKLEEGEGGGKDTRMGSKKLLLKTVRGAFVHPVTWLCALD